MRRRFQVKKLWITLISILAAIGVARAAVIEVAPVTIEMGPGMTSGTIVVTNHGAERAAVQVRGFMWSQTPTEDTLTRTDDLAISPPIFQLDHEEAQTVRIMLRRRPTTGEVSYRLLLDEIPSGRESRTIQFALRLSLPLFAQAENTGPDLVWHIDRSSDGVPELRVLNRGNRRDRLLNLLLQLPDGVSVKPEGLPNAYILPGVERHWRLPAERALTLHNSTIIRATGVDDVGPINVVVPLSP